MKRDPWDSRGSDPSEASTPGCLGVALPLLCQRLRQHRGARQLRASRGGGAGAGRGWGVGGWGGWGGVVGWGGGLGVVQW